ncbi:MAG: hypothetical protein ACJ72V_04595, partial [Nitrososphaeraceae archaeon]
SYLDSSFDVDLQVRSQELKVLDMVRTQQYLGINGTCCCSMTKEHWYYMTHLTTHMTIYLTYLTKM